MTFSILGIDPDSGEMGIGVQSKFPGVGGIVAHARAGAGVVATQAFADPGHGARGLELLARGASAAETLAILLRGDASRDRRQIAVLDRAGAHAAHTGDAVLGWDGWSGAAGGRLCVAHGNGLAGPEVAARMATAFGAGAGDVALRLIAALEAGQAAGGELRGQQSAAVLVVKEGGGYGGSGGRHVDISVYDHPAPIAELRRCYGLHRLSYFPSDPDEVIEIGPDLARELKAILIRRGFLDGDPGGPWDAAAIAAMERLMGTDNYDNRIRDDARIDTEVLADIRARHPA